MKRKALYLSSMAIAAASAGAMGNDGGAFAKHEQKIRLIIDGQVLSATLTDSPTSRDFVAMLPLTLTLNDYAGTEKISYLPRKLNTEAAPAGSKPRVGTIAYYAPWGNLAIYYNDFAYSPGLVLLGSINGDLTLLKRSGSLKVRIER